MSDRLFGVTTLDVVRASTFVADVIGDLSKSSEIVVPVVGGHSGVTVCSAFSRATRTLFICAITDRAPPFPIVPLAPCFNRHGKIGGAHETRPVRWRRSRQS